jgi:hypothetical protein
MGLDEGERGIVPEEFQKKLAHRALLWVDAIQGVLLVNYFEF